MRLLVAAHPENGLSPVLQVRHLVAHNLSTHPERKTLNGGLRPAICAEL